MIMDGNTKIEKKTNKKNFGYKAEATVRQAACDTLPTPTFGPNCKAVNAITLTSRMPS